MKKILVIEDEELVRANILDLLEAEDFEAIGAETGSIGVKKAQTHLPDLIICDVMMPDIDGYSVLSSLRQNHLTTTIPFIFLTAKAEKIDFRQGMRLGADDYLTKPCTTTELLEAIAIRFEKQAALQQRYTTELKQIEEQLNYLTYHDSLTNLPNQQSLRLQFNNQQKNAILLLGLDQFNRINATLGHSFGNLLLKAVGERLLTSIGDSEIVARLNADQFAIALKNINQNAATVAQTILQTISQPFLISNQEIFITASIGIAVYPENGSDIENLLNNAERAMCSAKQLLGNKYQFYTADMEVNSSNRVALESSLRRALSLNEFEVYYQPQVEIKTGKIIGAEALLRWRHPERGFISPAEFIPVAEETGLIVSIGEWVLRTVCTQAAYWHKNGFFPLRVAVNLSPKQLRQQDLCINIARILTETGLNSEFLELELTESIFIESAQVNTLQEIKKLGIKISIDDFGTGYSSLQYIQNFPFDTLKIDKCFISKIKQSAENSEITKTIIQMGRNLNLQVIAEGVETEDELAFLHEHQCDTMQGYLFSRALPVKEFEMLFAKERL